MKILMDADCLIKLTKAGLKELVAGENSIFISDVVKYEVVDAGKEKGCPDAIEVEKNLDARIIKIIETYSDHLKGDEVLIDLFSNAEYDAVATDDVKLTHLLMMKNIPFVLPALILYFLVREKKIDKKTGLGALKQLAEFISEDEYSTVRLLMEKRE